MLPHLYGDRSVPVLPSYGDDSLLHRKHAMVDMHGVRRLRHVWARVPFDHGGGQAVAVAKVCRSCQQPSDQPRHGLCSVCAEAARPAWQRAQDERGRPRDGIKPAEVAAGHKWCPDCRTVRPHSDFGTGLKIATYCAPCRSNRTLAETCAAFGITVEEYDALSAAQGHRCAICRGEPGRIRLAIDHRHVKGAPITRELVRGLVCFDCNHNKLKAFRHDALMLMRAADYLVNPPAWSVLDR